MKLITLHEPWATLLATGQKAIETRHWDDPYEGPVAIHAAKGGLSLRDLTDCCFEPRFFEALDTFWPRFNSWNSRDAATRPNLRKAEVFPFGCIIAVGTLVDCLVTEGIGCLSGVFDDYPHLNTPKERAFGDYSPRRYGFVFAEMKRLKLPVPYTSRQGKLLDLDFNTEALVRKQLP